MKGRTAIFILLVCMGIGNSCSESEKTTLCFLMSFTEVTPNGTETNVFTYNLSRPATWVRTLANGETITSNFQYYDVGLLMRLSIHYPTGEGRIDFGYDSVGRLIAQTATTAPESYTIRYKYNTNSQLMNSYFVVNDDTTQITTYTYPDIVTKNPSTIETLDLNLGLTTIHTYTYDDKIYPMRGMLPSEQRANNVISDSTVGGLTRTYSYQYNGAGYPVSATATGGISQSWTYDCQEI